MNDHDDDEREDQPYRRDNLFRDYDTNTSEFPADEDDSEWSQLRLALAIHLRVATELDEVDYLRV